MKILVISNLYPPFYLGGYELGCKQVVNGLSKLGHEVYVLTSFSHSPESGAEAFIYRQLDLKEKGFLPINFPGDYDRYQRFLSRVSNFCNTNNVISCVHKFCPDVVYVFNLVGIGGLAILSALNSMGVPWVTHLMDRYPVTLMEGVQKSVLEIYNARNGEIYSSGGIISMSNLLIEEIQTLGRFLFTNNPVIIPGWVDITGGIKRRQYLSEGKVRFVTAGAIYPHKGIDIIIDAVKKVLESKVQNFSVDIYGSGDIDTYIEKIRSEHLNEYIKLKGPRTQQELLCIYKNSDVFLFPTWEREPFGFAPVEAAAEGVVPIMTNVCGVSECFISGVNCLKVRRDAGILAETIIDICKKKYDLNSLGLSAQLITRQDLNFKSCLQKIIEVLSSRADSSYVKKLRPVWEDVNLAFLKNNLAMREF